MDQEAVCSSRSFHLAVSRRRRFSGRVTAVGVSSQSARIIVAVCAPCLPSPLTSCFIIMTLLLIFRTHPRQCHSCRIGCLSCPQFSPVFWCVVLRVCFVGSSWAPKCVAPTGELKISSNNFEFQPYYKNLKREGCIQRILSANFPENHDMRSNRSPKLIAYK